MVSLPVLSKGTPKLAPVATAAAALRAFSPYLSQKDAESLVRAGVQSPAGALALLQHPAPKTTDVPSALHLQVGQQAALEAAGAEPSLARYLVATKPRSLDALARLNPLDLAEELASAQALGLLGPGVDISAGAVAALLADLLVLIPGVVIWPGGVVFWPAETSVCSHPLPPNTHLENYYSTRFAPGGRSAEALTAEENAKQQWLAEVDDYLLDPQVPKPARTKAFVEAGLQLGRLAVADLERWFGTGAGLTWDFSERAMLEKLRDFMSSHLQVLQLLRLVAEGHDAFHHREYGLALAAYLRADEWFTAVCGDTIARRWWQNQTNAAGEVRPGFMLPDPLFDLAVAHYQSRRTAANPDTLLETLQVDLADYHRWPLFVLRDDPAELPFCRHLYYIAHFLLPVLKGDCYLRLGNFCAALDCYFQAHYEPAFTSTIDAPKDQQLAQRTRQGAPYPALFGTLYVPDEAGRYFPEFLNGVERAVIRLRVAELMIAWGDTHYRQRNHAAAEPCFAQTLRILYSTWQAISDDATGDQAAFAARVDQLGLNPRAVALAFTAHRELAKLAAAVNYLGYPDNYVPIWTYAFLLSSARYFAERARQAGRDALQFLASAEQEQGNRRLLLQNAAIAEAQLAVESRRADEGAAAVTLAQAGALLADQRVAHAESRQAELALYGPTRQALGVVGGAMAGAGQGAGIGGAIGGPFGQGGGAVGALTGMPLGMAGGAFTLYLSGAISSRCSATSSIASGSKWKAPRRWRRPKSRARRSPPAWPGSRGMRPRRRRRSRDRTSSTRRPRRSTPSSGTRRRCACPTRPRRCSSARPAWRFSANRPSSSWRAGGST